MANTKSSHNLSNVIKTIKQWVVDNDVGNNELAVLANIPKGTVSKLSDPLKDPCVYAWGWIRGLHYTARCSIM